MFANLYRISDGCWMQCLIVSCDSRYLNFRNQNNFPCGSSILCSTASLKDVIKKWHYNGSPAKVRISISGADCCHKKLHNILLISPSVSLGNKTLFAWASAAQLVLSHDFFEDDFMVLLFKAFDASIAPLYDDLFVASVFVDENPQLSLCWMQPGFS